MDAGLHPPPQRAVDRLMALDQALALETLAYHQRLEMVAAASEVAHLNMRARQPALDHCLYLLRFHQSIILYPSAPGLANSTRPSTRCHVTRCHVTIGS